MCKAVAVVLIIAFGMTFGNSYAQQPFIRFITAGEDVLHCYPSGITRNADGSFTASFVFESRTHNNFWTTAVTKFDSLFGIHPGVILGDTGSTQLLQQGFGGTALPCSSGGGLVFGNVLQYYSNITSGNLGIVRYDDAGKILWSKSYDGHGHNNRLSGVLLRKNGTMVLSNDRPGYMEGADDQLIALDTSGNVLWSRLYVDTVFHDGIFFGCGLTEAADGSMVLSGTTQGYASSLMCPYIQKMDSAGHVLWRRTYSLILDTTIDVVCNALTPLADGGMAFEAELYADSTFNLCVVLVQPDGSIRRSLMAPLEREFRAGAITQLNSGDIVVCGTFVDSANGTGRMLFLEFHNDGELVRTAMLPDPVARGVGGLLPLLDGGFLAEGSNAIEEPFVMKLDSDLSICNAQSYPIHFYNQVYWYPDSTIREMDSTPAILVSTGFVSSTDALFGSYTYCSTADTKGPTANPGSEIHIYPNPITASGNERLYITGLPEGTYTVTLEDEIGRAIRRSKLNASADRTESISLQAVGLAGQRCFVRIEDARSGEHVADIPLVIAP